jgi:hypothetical protein
MRAAGRLTQRDLDTMRAFHAALVAVRQGAGALAAAATANAPAITAMLQAGRAAALSRAFDAQPRHRELPDRATVHDWLDRHGDAADVAILGERLRNGERVEFRIIDDPVLPPWLDRRPSLNDPRAVEWISAARRPWHDGRRRFERDLLGEWAPDEPTDDGVYADVEARLPYRRPPTWSMNWTGGVGG